jgi:hypothetical protein
MKELLSIVVGLSLASGLALSLWGCRSRDPQRLASPQTQFINSAPCYSGICPANCRNRANGIPCSTSGAGAYCSPSVTCRGTILDK